MGRKDRERFQRMRESNPDYVGYRGLDTETAQAPPPEVETVTVVCSVCQRKRNVASATLSEDISTFICLSCQENAV